MWWLSFKIQFTWTPVNPTISLRVQRERKHQMQQGRTLARYMDHIHVIFFFSCFYLVLPFFSPLFLFRILVTLNDSKHFQREGPVVSFLCWWLNTHPKNVCTWETKRLRKMWQVVELKNLLGATGMYVFKSWFWQSCSHFGPVWFYLGEKAQYYLHPAVSSDFSFNFKVL